jgi:hypothetical protein
MRMAKADEKDFETTLTFLKAAENMWSKRPYEWNEPCEEWDDWDDEDEDKQLLLRLRSRIAKEERISESDVDNRIVIYEFLRLKYKECDCNWARVYWAAQILVPEVCDPQKDYLDYSPYLEELHTDKEQ